MPCKPKPHGKPKPSEVLKGICLFAGGAALGIAAAYVNMPPAIFIIYAVIVTLIYGFMFMKKAPHD